MSSTKLTSRDHDILRDCLRAAADGPFFPDWEFETLIGATRAEVRELASLPQPLEAAEEGASEIAANVLNNLLGYPHAQERALSSFTSATRAELNKLLERVAAMDNGPEE